jgi:hypothetical protein
MEAVIHIRRFNPAIKASTLPIPLHHATTNTKAIPRACSKRKSPRRESAKKKTKKKKTAPEG